MPAPGHWKSYLASLLQMNDWPIRRFLILIVALQLSVWGLMLLGEIGFSIPIIGQIIVFLYLTFAPGYLILRCLRLHQLGSIETPLYAVGLSLFTLMTAGFITNFLFPLVDIHNPISRGPLMLTISSIVLLLSGLSYWRDGNYRVDVSPNSPDPSLSSVLLLGFFPFLAILGTYLVNAYQNNVLLMVMILGIACMALVIGFSSRIPENLYPFAILSIAIALLLHTSLISLYLTGADIHIEQHFSALTQTTSSWGYTIVGNVNAVLSTTLLCPIYSLLLDMDAVWVYKIVYPLLFSLVPLGLYQAYSRLVTEKMAFLSVFFFISVSSYFSQMLSLARQQVAELFLVLFMLLILNPSLRSPKKKILSIVFLAGMVISHYSLAWMYIFLLTLALMIYTVFKKTGRAPLKAQSLITAQLLGVYIGFNLLWHYFVPASTVFEDLRTQIAYLYTAFSSSLFKLKDTQPATILSEGIMTHFHIISKFLNIVALLLLFIGVAATLLALYRGSKADNFSLQREYYAIALANAFVFAVGFVLPNFFMLNVPRVYHIVLLFLAPFALMGGMVVLRHVSRFGDASWLGNSETSLKILSVFIVLLFLFSSGFIYEVTGDHPLSISLSHESVQKFGDIDDLNSYYADYCPEQDVFGARWLSHHYDAARTVLADYRGKMMPILSYGMLSDVSVIRSTTDLKEHQSYLYLGYANTRFGIINGPYDFSNYWPLSDISPAVNGLNKVYTNDFCIIYT